MQNENVSDTTTMKGKVVMVTGANSGIGKAASLALAKMGAILVMVARNPERGEAARSEIITKSKNKSVDLLLADLSSLESVRSLAAEFQKKYSNLHVLINNAGLFNQRRNVTTDGRSEEHTSELQSLAYLVCRLLLEKKKKNKQLHSDLTERMIARS